MLKSVEICYYYVIILVAFAYEMALTYESADKYLMREHLNQGYL